MNAREYLRKREWSMGNGQCPECCGVSPDWLGHPLHLDSSTIGHKPACPLAASLASLGAHPLMLGDFASDAVFECFMTDDRILSTRPKTKNGCPNIKSMNEQFDKKLLDAVLGTPHNKSLEPTEESRGDSDKPR